MINVNSVPKATTANPTNPVVADLALARQLIEISPIPVNYYETVRRVVRVHADTAAIVAKNAITVTTEIQLKEFLANLVSAMSTAVLAMNAKN